MALINKLDNAASVLFDGVPVVSNTVETLLSLPPTILKAVDKLTASINDVLTYTVTITNVSALTISNLPFTDILPEGVTYQQDSFTVNGAAATPTVTGNTLDYTIPSVGFLVPTTVQFKALVVGGNI